MAPFDRPPPPPPPVEAGEVEPTEVEFVEDAVAEGFEALVVAVKLYLQDFVYQASYKLKSADLHVVVEELQSGFGSEHTQLEVCSRQTFALSKQLRAQLGISLRSTSGFPGHCVSYQSSVRFQQSQFALSWINKGEVKNK